MSLDLLTFLIRTVAVSLVAAGVLLVFRNASAARLHAVAAAALVSTLILAPASLVFKRALPAVVTTPVSRVFVSQLEPDLAEATPATVSAKENPRSTAQEIQPVEQPVPLTVNLASIWLVGSAILALRLLFGLVAVGVRIRRSTPTVEARDLGRRVTGPDIRVRVDPLARVPLAIWWGRPTIILPPTWGTWSESRLETVLRHETAHLRRGDWWIQLAAALARAMCWPNPLVWWLASRARTLAEEAVDDFVLASGVSPANYAQDLLDIARQGRTTAFGPELPMAARNGVEARIRTIMNLHKQRGSIPLVAIAALGAGFFSLALGASAWSLVPQRIEAAALSLPAVSGSIETLDPLAGVARGPVTPASFLDEPASLRSTGAHGLSANEIALGGAAPNVPQSTHPLPPVKYEIGDPNSKYWMVGNLWVVDGSVPAPKEFGTWAHPSVKDKDIPSFESAMRSAGGRYVESDGVHLLSSSPTPSKLPTDPGGVPSFFPNMVMDGTVVVHIVVPNSPAKSQLVLAAMHVGDHLVYPVRSKDDSKWHIWIFQLKDYSAAADQPARLRVHANRVPQGPYAPPPADLKVFDVQEEHYTLSSKPKKLNLRGVWARQSGMGFQEWDMRPEEVASFREQLKEANATLDQSPRIHALYGSAVTTYEAFPNGEENNRLTFYASQDRTWHVDVSLQSTKEGSKVTYTSVHELPDGCSRVLIIPVTPDLHEVFILTPKAAEKQ